MPVFDFVKNNTRVEKFTEEKKKELLSTKSDLTVNGQTYRLSQGAISHIKNGTINSYTPVDEEEKKTLENFKNNYKVDIIDSKGVNHGQMSYGDVQKITGLYDSDFAKAPVLSVLMPTAEKQILSTLPDVSRNVWNNYTAAENKYQRDEYNAKYDPNGIAAKYGYSAYDMDQQDLEEWAQKNNHFFVDNVSYYGGKQGGKNFSVGINATEEQKRDGAVLRMIVENNEARKNSAIDMGAATAGAYGFGQGALFGTIPALYEWSKKAQYENAGLNPEMYVSTSEKMAKTTNEHKVATISGNITGSVVTSIATAGAISSGLAAAGWANTTAPIARGAVVQGLTGVIRGGTTTAAQGGDWGDIGINALREGLTGAAGGAVGGIAEKGLTKLLNNSKYATSTLGKLKDLKVTAYGVNALGGVADALADYKTDQIFVGIANNVFDAGLQERTGKDLLTDFAVSLALGTAMNIKQNTKAGVQTRIDDVVNRYGAEFTKYSQQISGADVDVETRIKAGEEFIETTNKFKKEFNEQLFPGMAQRVEELQEMLDVAIDSTKMDIERAKSGETKTESAKPVSTETSVVPKPTTTKPTVTKIVSTEGGVVEGTGKDAEYDNTPALPTSGTIEGETPNTRTVIPTYEEYKAEIEKHYPGIDEKYIQERYNARYSVAASPDVKSEATDIRIEVTNKVPSELEKTVKSVKVLTGIDIVFGNRYADGEIDANFRGLFDGKKIIVSENATKADVFNAVVLHELTHGIEGTKKYKGIYDYVLKEMYGNDTARLDADVKEKIAEYKKNGIELTPEKAKGEIVAENVGKYIFADDVGSIVAKNYTLGQKILDVINELIYNIKKKFGNTFELGELAAAQRKYRMALAEGKGKKSEFDLKKSVEETKDLIAIHNMSESQLIEALERGSLIAPSTAVTNKGHTQFGEFSVIFGKESIDPLNSTKNKLYGADAWTPTQTTLKLNPEFDTAKTDATIQRIEKDIGEGWQQIFTDDSAQFQGKIKAAQGSVYGAYAEDIGMQTAFAIEKGLIQDVPKTNGKIDAETLKNNLDGILNQDKVWREYKKWLSNISDDVITSYDKASTQQILDNMNAQPATAKVFNLSESGELTVPAVPYKSIDEMRSNKGRLSETADAETKTAGSEFVSWANKIGNKTGASVADVVKSINSSFGNRYDARSIGTAFKNNGIDITHSDAKALQSLYKRAVELPTRYFEAKPQREVNFNEVAHIVIPDNASAATRAKLDALGMPYTTYKAGDTADRISKVNSIEEAKFLFKPEDVDSALADFEAHYGEMYRNLVDEYKTIKPGEIPQVEDVKVPKKSGKRQYVSNYARTMAETKVFSDAMQGEFEKMVVDGTLSHERISNKSAESDAGSRIVRLGFEGAVNEFETLVNSGRLNKNDIALGQTLLNVACQNKDVELAKKLAVDLSMAATQFGQNVQAFSMLKRMSPDGQLYYLEKTVQKINDDIVKKYNGKKSVVEIDNKLAEDLLNAKNQDEINEAVYAIEKNIGKQMPANWVDKWNAWRYLAMLGNTRTHFRNIVGNMGFVPARKLKDLIGTPIEKVVLPKNERTKSYIKTKESKEFAKQDFEKMSEVIKGNEGKYGTQRGIEEHRKIFETKWLEAARKFNGDALEWEDGLFLELAYKDAFAQAMTARGLTSDYLSSGTKKANADLQKIREYAINEAQKATYRDSNAFSEFVNKFGFKGDNAVSKTANILVEGILPFKKTPANILVRGVEYSPVGLIKTITADSYKLKNGNISASKYIDNLSSGLTGTVIAALGAFLSHLGILVVSPDEDEDIASYKKMMGAQNYALKFGDNTYTIDWMAPSSLPLFVGAEAYNTAKSTEGFTFKNVTDAMSRISEPMFELSCLSGVQDALESIKYAEDGNTVTSLIADVIASYVSQALPTIGGQFARTIDDTQRNAYYKDKKSTLPVVVESFINKAKAKIPFVSKMLPEKIDRWGRTQKYGGTVERVLENFVSPGYYSKEAPTWTDKRIMEIYKNTGNKSVIPKNASKSFEVKGKMVYLSPDEYVEYSKTKGQLSYKYVTEFLKIPSNIDDETRVEIISAIYEYSNAKAKEKASDYELAPKYQKVDDAMKRGTSPAKYYFNYYKKKKKD